MQIENQYDLATLRRIFTAQGGFATGAIVNMFAAAAPADLERDGWIEKTRSVGRWDVEGYKPTEKLMNF